MRLVVAALIFLTLLTAQELRAVECHQSGGVFLAWSGCSLHP